MKRFSTKNILKIFMSLPEFGDRSKSAAIDVLASREDCSADDLLVFFEAFRSSWLNEQRLAEVISEKKECTFSWLSKVLERQRGDMLSSLIFHALIPRLNTFTDNELVSLFEHGDHIASYWYQVQEAIIEVLSTRKTCSVRLLGRLFHCTEHYRPRCVIVEVLQAMKNCSHKHILWLYGHKIGGYGEDFVRHDLVLAARAKGYPEPLVVAMTENLPESLWLTKMVGIGKIQ